MPESSRGAVGLLYVVATPIGNSEDISTRAIRVLRDADFVACEDTRRTGRLLAMHAIRTPMISYFEHNELRRIPELVTRLSSGARIALVTDAGTPAISDPGFRLVRSAIDAGIEVIAIPGPCAAITALTVAGLPTDRFVFEGFLPARTGEREGVIARLAKEERTLIIYEAARRLPRLITELIGPFGRNRRLAVVREATKIHEEVVRGTLEELAEIFANQEVLGEVTLVIEGCHNQVSHASTLPIAQSRVVEILRDAGMSLKQAAATASRITGASQRHLYQEALKRDE